MWNSELVRKHNRQTHPRVGIVTKPLEGASACVEFASVCDDGTETIPRPAVDCVAYSQRERGLNFSSVYP